MSKLPKNFEKTLLGVAGVAALGCIALGYVKSNAVDADFSRAVAGDGKNDPSIPEALATSKAVSSLASDRVIETAEDEGRPVDLFVGIPLFADKNNPNEPVDLIDGKEVHPGIPNRWWIQNGADITFANSPDRDDDNDGFSNREEFKAKTHPVDAKSIPALVNKLAYLKDESTMWYIQFGMESEGKWAPKLTALTHDKKRIQNKISAIKMLSPGDTFFVEGAMAGRFKFIGIIEKEVISERTKLVQKVKFGQYEDLKANKKGEPYESQSGLPDAQLVASAYHDRTAVLDLRAIGYEGKEFKVEERTRFALPPDAKEKAYLLKKVTPEAIEVEYTDASGAAQTLEISKGNTP
ncbi:MAG: hypothetical protein EAZ84_04120 [Verrucomicrobia bacterium]|nr:MAG: hypothetical protein EAZ84_04120 [Verrucomicrobiota bacterium]TAE86496.1 MAG: hypothetical protein EAZ82_10705 [Verrucomicrobiota bacterium]TAF24132.1 MAG: hypothetical protein EAZ71_11175 [Verrucomicrobiota bacterium]